MLTMRRGPSHGLITAPMRPGHMEREYFQYFRLATHVAFCNVGLHYALLVFEGLTMSLIVVKAAYDPEAKVWFVEESDLPGLNVETDTIEAMIQQLPLAIADLLENTDESA